TATVGTPPSSASTASRWGPAAASRATGRSPMSTTRGEAVAAALRARVAARSLWLDVSGPSMGRAILSGTRVLVVEADCPRWGEIWAFCDAGGAIVVHRFRR